VALYFGLVEDWTAIGHGGRLEEAVVLVDIVVDVVPSEFGCFFFCFFKVKFVKI